MLAHREEVVVADQVPGLGRGGVHAGALAEPDKHTTYVRNSSSLGELYYREMREVLGYGMLSGKNYVILQVNKL